MRKLSLAKASCFLFGIWLVLAIHASAQTFTVLQNFEQSDPTAALVQGLDGNFYGTMEGGGDIGFEGNVYTLTPGGTYTSIAAPCCYSYAPLVLASNGYFYGSTQEGGTALQGNIYKMTASGAETTLYSFCTTTCEDSSDPHGPLVQLGNGDLYGTTVSTIFKITLAGELTTLYNFCPGTTCNDGVIEPSGLVLGSDGNFYGVTGTSQNDGTVFKMTPAGTLTTLHTFSGTDGSNPLGSLVQATNGYLYGVTLTGGTGVNHACNLLSSAGCGTIFKISTSGAFTSLHEFAGRDGANPYAGLVLATDGNLYGTTEYGGNNSANAGTIFVISPSGAFAKLYNFCSQTDCLDGADPLLPLMQATSGTLYGTTLQGGTEGNGIFFSLSRGLRPFVKTIPVQGNAGTKVIILGNGLTAATGVTFHGVAATFSVVSDAEMTATVPTGATTGTVVVTTSGGSLESNVAFRVGH